MQPPTIDKEAILAEHPKAIFLNIDLGPEDDAQTFTFAFAPPKRTHINMATATKKISKNLENMVMACLIAPEKDAAKEIFDVYAAAPTSLGNALLEAAGLREATVLRP